MKSILAVAKVYSDPGSWEGLGGWTHGHEVLTNDSAVTLSPGVSAQSQVVDAVSSLPTKGWLAENRSQRTPHEEGGGAEDPCPH